MKKYMYFLGLGALLIGLVSASSSTVSYPYVRNTTFQTGEKLTYRVTYGFVDAGEATIEVKSTSKKGQGRELQHVVATGKTLSSFNNFYKVYDVYESYIDKKSIMPWYFVRNVDEGGYKINQQYTFKHHVKKVNNGKKDFDVNIGIQDMISSFYKARTLNMKGMKPGKVFSFRCFMDDEIYDLKIKYKGKDRIKIRQGEFQCYKFVPVVQTGRYFESEEDVQFWVTADQNRIPVLVKAKIPVGTVKMHLIDWKGLKNGLTSKVG